MRKNSLTLLAAATVGLFAPHISPRSKPRRPRAHLGVFCFVISSVSPGCSVSRGLAVFYVGCHNARHTERSKLIFGH